MRLITMLIPVLSLLAQPVCENVEWGWASGYSEGVMSGVIETRFDNDWWRNRPPLDWYQAAGAVAVMDCSDVGLMMTLFDDAGHQYRVLAADCAGDDGHPDRFVNDSIIVELDYNLWQSLVARYGRPLRVGILKDACRLQDVVVQYAE